MSLPSLSSIQRAMECPASCALPQTKHVSAPSERGKAIHAYLSAVPRLGAAEALDLVPDEHRPACEAIDLSKLPACDPEAFAAEVGLAYNVDTGEARDLGRDLDRQYPDLGPRWIYGTLDTLGLSPNEAVVLDAKTGWGHVPSADRNWQLRAGAVAACAAFGRTSASVGLIYLNLDPARFDTAALSEFDLAMAGADLATMADRVEAAQAEVAAGKMTVVTEGEHCTYCPAFMACPAKHALVTRLAMQPDQVASDLLANLTPETSRAAYLRLKEINTVVAKVSAALDEYSQQSPIQLSESLYYGPRPHTVEKISGGAAAVATITRVLGKEHADRASEITVTKGALDKECKRWKELSGATETLKDIKTRVYGEIRKVGGLSKSTTYPIGEYSQKK